MFRTIHPSASPQRRRAGSWLCLLPSNHGLFLRKSHHYSMEWVFLSVKAAVYFTDSSQPVLSPRRWLWFPSGPPWSRSQLHFEPSVCHKPLSPPSPMRLRTSPHCLNLKPQFSCLDFVAIHIKNLSSFKSFNLQQLPPEGWEVQFLCRYLCLSRRFQELQLSLTSVQCSIKWTVYGNKFKMFTILYILYI